MSSAILSPFFTLTELPTVDALLRVIAVLLGMARQSKRDKELTECNQCLRDCRKRLRQSEEKQKKFEEQRDMLVLVLLIVIAVGLIASINYRVVPRSLPA